MNLYKLCDAYNNILYEPELFPAARLCMFNPLCVNVFHTGSVIVCGLREQADLNFIVQSVINMCQIL